VPVAHDQRTFDDLGTPLGDVTFCVLDLETTGGSPADCSITEVGAIKVRGGEATLEEPVGYCPTCRRDFFPSASGTEN